MLDLSSVKHPIQHIQWVQKLLCGSLHRIAADSPAAAPQTHTGCSYETAAVQSVIGIVNKKCLDLCIRLRNISRECHCLPIFWATCFIKNFSKQGTSVGVNKNNNYHHHSYIIIMCTCMYSVHRHMCNRYMYCCIEPAMYK